MPGLFEGFFARHRRGVTLADPGPGLAPLPPDLQPHRGHQAQGDRAVRGADSSRRAFTGFFRWFGDTAGSIGQLRGGPRGARRGAGAPGGDGPAPRARSSSCAGRTRRSASSSDFAQTLPPRAHRGRGHRPGHRQPLLHHHDQQGLPARREEGDARGGLPGRHRGPRGEGRPRRSRLLPGAPALRPAVHRLRARGHHPRRGPRRGAGQGPGHHRHELREEDRQGQDRLRRPRRDARGSAASTPRASTSGASATSRRRPTRPPSSSRSQPIIDFDRLEYLVPDRSRGRRPPRPRRGSRGAASARAGAPPNEPGPARRSSRRSLRWRSASCCSPRSSAAIAIRGVPPRPRPARARLRVPAPRADGRPGLRASPRAFSRT